MNFSEIRTYLWSAMKIVILCLAILLWIWFYQPICDTSLPNCTLPSPTYLFIFLIITPIVLIIVTIKMFGKGKK